MLLCLQNYDVTIKYCPGKEMLVADAISHYVPPDASEIPLTFHKQCIHYPTKGDIVPGSYPWWTTFVLPCRHNLCWLASGHKPFSRSPIHPYHAHHDVLTVEDDLILCGEALVIPPTDRVDSTLSNSWRLPRHNQVPVLCSTMCLLA